MGDAEAEEHASEVERLRAERDRLRRSQKLRDETSALVVHDMKNPLSGVISNAEYLVTTSGLNTDQSECVHDILLASRRLHRLVLSLLDVSLRDHGLLDPSITTVELGELVAEIVHESAATLEEKSLQCEVSGPTSKLTLAADRDMLARLVGNLIDNAARSSPHGGKIGVELSGGPHSVRVRVSDTGAQLAPELRGQLFEMHVPTDEAIRRARKGRGLGLTSCRYVVEAHGGSIGADDNLPVGSVLWVELPRTQGERKADADGHVPGRFG